MKVSYLPMLAEHYAISILKKSKRLIESTILPVEPGRKGECTRCAACCKISFRCIFLKKKNECAIYPIRPPNCRKFPRRRIDLTEVNTCGFYWPNGDR